MDTTANTTVKVSEKPLRKSHVDDSARGNLLGEMITASLNE